MKMQYVETKNWQLFNDAVKAIRNTGSPEAKILLLDGEPATGKTRAVDRFGAENNAVLLEGMPGMGVTFIADYLADRLGVRETRKYDKYMGILSKLAESGSPIILDEAQHAVVGSANALEYLRRVAEQANVMLILVCHTSEKHKFTEKKMAHINTRITANPSFKPADLADCKLYMTQKCEVALDEEIMRSAHNQSRGRYRLLNNAIKTLEAFASLSNKTALTKDDVKDMRLCEDVARGV